MVGHAALDRVIGVRIPASQPNSPRLSFSRAAELICQSRIGGVMGDGERERPAPLSLEPVRHSRSGNAKAISLGPPPTVSAMYCRPSTS